MGYYIGYLGGVITLYDTILDGVEYTNNYIQLITGSMIHNTLLNNLW